MLLAAQYLTEFLSISSIRSPCFESVRESVKVRASDRDHVYACKWHGNIY